MAQLVNESKIEADLRPFAEIALKREKSINEKFEVDLHFAEKIEQITVQFPSQFTVVSDTIDYIAFALSRVS